MLTHIVTSSNRMLYREYLRLMFVQRKEVFIDRLGWSALRADEGMETDDLDELPDLEYLLTIEEGGDLIGSCRLVPTTGPHLLAGPLAHFVMRPYEPSATCWEITRYIPSVVERGEVAMAGRAYMALALVEWALRRGVTRLLGISPEATMAYTTRMGWRTSLLGMPQPYENDGQGLAMAFDIDQETLRSTRAYWDIDTPATVEIAASEAGGPITRKQLADLENAVHHRAQELDRAIALHSAAA